MSKIKVPLVLVSSISLPGLQMASFLLCSHMAFPLCMGEGRGSGEDPDVSSFSYKDTSPLGLGPHPYDPNYLLKGPISKDIWQWWGGVGYWASTYELEVGRDTQFSLKLKTIFLQNMTLQKVKPHALQKKKQTIRLLS